MLCAFMGVLIKDCVFDKVIKLNAFNPNAYRIYFIFVGNVNEKNLQSFTFHPCICSNTLGGERVRDDLRRFEREKNENHLDSHFNNSNN